MDKKLITELSTKNVSFNIISEFLLACAAVGEDRVIMALRSVQQLNAQSLKKNIINITCKVFEVHPSFLRNMKIQTMTNEQKICYSAVIFLIKKHLKLTYSEIFKLLTLRNVANWKKLSEFNSRISKLNEKQPVHQRYIRLINIADNKIKQYILTSYNINYDGKEKPIQRNRG
jgi:uncharacterized protein YfbU (UPF0304 family)